MWRLATSINYVCQKIYSIGRQTQVEIVVTDWGSKVPISDVIKLTKQASNLTRFIEVPLGLAGELQKDSAFGEVYALNVAARRSRGQYIARIDQDTLTTIDFLNCFFGLIEGKSQADFDIENTYMFAARKQLPYNFVEQKPSLNDLDLAITNYAHVNLSEELPYCYWASAVGILMMHRNLWEKVGGYDERLIYYWFMDVDLATRLISQYPIVNWGKKFGYHFFHLEHMSTGLKFRHSHRKLNPAWAKSFDKPSLNPNGSNWGLENTKLNESTTRASYIDESHLKVLTTSAARTRLLLSILIMSLKGLGYNTIRYLRYLTKRAAGKPFL